MKVEPNLSCGIEKNHINTEGMVIFSSHYRLEMRGMDTIDLEKYAKN